MKTEDLYDRNYLGLKVTPSTVFALVQVKEWQISPFRLDESAIFESIIRTSSVIEHSPHAFEVRKLLKQYEGILREIQDKKQELGRTLDCPPIRGHETKPSLHLAIDNPEPG